tara:strand:+ start:1076 stop:1891 length:816 start_codon:yes stop_codon:yes gene_type:complete
MNKLDNIKNILNDEGIDLEPYRSSDDDRIKKWIVMIECRKNKPSRRLSYYNQIKIRSKEYSKWYCSVCNHQSNSARGFKYHIESEAHKLKCGTISKMVCPFCKTEIVDGTLEDHIKKSPSCKKAKKKKEYKDHKMRQWERDRELYKMDVNDPDIWFPDLIREYNRRLEADDGWHRNEDIPLDKNSLGLLVPITKLPNYKQKYNIREQGEFCPIEEEEEIKDFDISNISYNELLELFEAGDIEPKEYQFLYNKKQRHDKDYKITEDFLNKIS